MSLGNHLVETEADLEVKRVAWRGTEGRLRVWAKQFAETCPLEHGKKKAQNAVLTDAENEMFPRRVVKGMGIRLYKMESASPKVQNRLSAEISDIKAKFAHSIGLGKALR